LIPSKMLICRLPIISFRKGFLTSLLILQPVTPYGGCTAPTAEHLLAFQRLALRHVSDVRIIPQTHRMMDLL